MEILKNIEEREKKNRKTWDSKRIWKNRKEKEQEPKEWKDPLRDHLVWSVHRSSRLQQQRHTFYATWIHGENQGCAAILKEKKRKKEKERKKEEKKRGQERFKEKRKKEKKVTSRRKKKSHCPEYPRRLPPSATQTYALCDLTSRRASRMRNHTENTKRPNNKVRKNNNTNDISSNNTENRSTERKNKAQ